MKGTTRYLKMTLPFACAGGAVAFLIEGDYMVGIIIGMFAMATGLIFINEMTEVVELASKDDTETHFLNAREL